MSYYSNKNNSQNHGLGANTPPSKAVQQQVKETGKSNVVYNSNVGGYVADTSPISAVSQSAPIVTVPITSTGAQYSSPKVNEIIKKDPVTYGLSPSIKFSAKPYVPKVTPPVTRTLSIKNAGASSITPLYYTSGTMTGDAPEKDNTALIVGGMGALALAVILLMRKK